MHECFSVHESQFTYLKSGKQVWLLGLINNRTKEFRLQATTTRNSINLKKFIISYIDSGNTIITEGWQGYAFLQNNNSYVWEMHNHGAGDFGIGINSTSHIESLWHEIKSKFKNTYLTIPSIHFLYFLREIEFKINIKI